MPSRKRRLSKLANELQPLLRNGSGGGSVQVSGGGSLTPDNNYLLRSGLLAMTGNLNMGANAIFNVGTVDGVDVSELALDQAAVDSRLDALESRTVETDGPGLTSDGVVLGDGNPGITFDPTAIAGVALTTSGSGDAEQLDVQTGYGAKITSGVVGVDMAYDFDWTGDHTFASTLGSPTFISGYTGTGWRIDTDEQLAAFHDVTVRGSLNAYELLARQIRATNGNVFISSTGKVATVSGSGPYTVTCEEVHGFAVGDLIKAQRITGESTYSSKMTVTAVTGDGKGFTATLNSGNAPAAGYEYVRHGNTTDADRQGTIYLAADDDYSPFIDIVDNVDSWADWDGGTKVKARFGNLAGITDDNMGVLSGYGMWSDSVYLNGEIVAADGDVTLNTYGLQILAAGLGGSGLENSQSVEWSTDPFSTPTWGTRTARIIGRHFDSGGTIYNRMNLNTWAGSNSSGSDTGTDVASIEINAGYLDDTESIQSALKFEVASGVSSALLLLMSSGSASGELVVQGTGPASPAVIRPFFDSGMNLGSDDYKIKEIHVETLYAGTTSSLDTGHNHNDIYYTESEVDTLLSGKADAVHTHTGYATTVDLADYALDADLTTHTGNAALHRTISDGTATTTALWSGEYINTQLGNKASTAYVDAQLSAKADAADLTAHTGDASIHFEIDDTAATGSTVVWSVDKLQAELAAVVVDDVAYTNVDNNFTASQTITGNLSVSGAITGNSATTTSDLTAGRYVIAETGALFGASETTATAGSPIGLLLALTHSGSSTTPRYPDYALEVDGTTNLSGGDITLNDYWVIQESGGQIRSTDPAWSATGGGLRLDPSGEIDAVRLTGSHLTVTAAVFEYNSEIVSGGSQRWTPGGAAALLEETTFDPAAASVDVPVEDPEYGHYQRFEVGDIVSVVGKFEIEPAESDYLGLIPVWDQVFNAQRLGNSIERNFEIWLQVESVTDNDTHFTYTCTYAREDRSWTRGTFYAGAGVVGYGGSDLASGYIKIAANEDSISPYMAVFTYQSKPWDSSPTVWIGNLAGVAMGADDEQGIAIGDNLESTDGSYIYASNERVEIQNVPQVLTDEDGNPVVEILLDSGITIHTGGETEVRDARRELTIFDDDTNSVLARLGPGYGPIVLYENPAEARSVDLWAPMRAYYDDGTYQKYLAQVNIVAGDESVSDESSSFEDPYARIQVLSKYSTVAPQFGESFIGLNARQIDIGAYSDDSKATYVNVVADTMTITSDYLYLTGSNIIMTQLPTESTGLPSGALWNDSGTLKVA